MRIKILILLLLMSSSTYAAGRGPFGLGIILGTFNGLTMKIKLNKSNALTGGLTYEFGGNDRLQVYSDYNLITIAPFRTDITDYYIYYGLGGHLDIHGDRSRILVRVPLGMGYMFDDFAEAFLEFVPSLEFIPDLDVHGGLGLGFRYFF